MLFCECCASEREVTILLVFYFLTKLGEICYKTLCKKLRIGGSVVILFLFLLNLLCPFDCKCTRNAFDKVICDTVGILLCADCFIVKPCCKCFPFVVGTRTATCLLSATALKAARIATSVFPNPTSPQTRRSIGRSLSISALTSIVALL